MIERNEESQVRAAEESLLRTFEGRLPALRVTAEVDAARKEFANVKIRTYVPVLVERSAKQRLLTLVQPAQAAAVG